MNETDRSAKSKWFQARVEDPTRTRGGWLRAAWLVWLALGLAWFGAWWWLDQPAPSWHGCVGSWTGDRTQARPLWNLQAYLREGTELTKMDKNPAYRVSGGGVELGLWRDKTTEWSWADWVFVERLPREKTSPIVVLASIRAGSAYGWELRLQEDHLVAAVDAMEASGADPRIRMELRAPDALPQARWTHVAFTSNRGLHKLFINGALQAEGASLPPVSLQLAALNVSALSPAWVGERREELSVVWHDDILAWDRALKAEEVVALVSAGRGAWGRIADRRALATQWMARGRPAVIGLFGVLVLLSSAAWFSARLRMFVEELPRPSFRPVVIVAAAGIVLTAAATAIVKVNGHRADEAKFDELLQRMHWETDGYWEKLAGFAMRARDWLASHPEPTPAAWAVWLQANHFPHDYPGVIGIGYAEQVLPSTLAPHEAKWTARYGFPYRVHPARDERRARPVLELTGEPQLPVVLYAPNNLDPERWLTNGSMLGRDLLFVSREDRREWSESIRVEQAVARNEVTSSSLEEIAPEAWFGKPLEGLRLYVPWTLRGKSNAAGPLEPEGWSGVWFLSVDARSVVAGALAGTRPLVGFRMHTGAMSGQRYDLVVDTGEINTETADRSGAYLRRTIEIPFYHYRLFVDVWTTPAFEAQSTLWWPWWIAGGGTGITALVAALLFVQVRAREAQQAVLDALREANSRLLAAYRDREHLSRDLHDGSIQNLYALGLHLKRVEQLLATKPARAREELRESLGFLDHSIAELRHFILSAGVESLDHQTTASALEGLVARLRGAIDVELRLQCHPAAEQLSPSVGVQVLHLVREAVSNALRHSGARVLEIALTPIGKPDQPANEVGKGQANGWWRLTIADDGKGFDPNCVTRNGRGLANLDARASELGGQRRLESAPGRGTKIIVEFPAHT